MLQNAGFTAFTISELLTKKQLVNTPPPPRLIMEVIMSVEIKLFKTKKLKEHQECLHYILAINTISAVSNPAHG